MQQKKSFPNEIAGPSNSFSPSQNHTNIPTNHVRLEKKETVVK